MRNMSTVLRALLVVAVAACSIALVGAFEFRPCDQTGGSELISARLSACPSSGGAFYCVIERGADVDYELQFKTAKPFAEAHFAISFLDFSQGGDACNFGVTCPSEAGQLQHLNKTTYLNRQLLAPGKGAMRLELLDPNSWDLLFCVEFPAQVL